MQITTYYVTHKAGQIDADARAGLHLINDTAFCNGDNRSWNAMRAQVDALLDKDTQRQLGVMIEAEQCESFED